MVLQGSGVNAAVGWDKGEMLVCESCRRNSTGAARTSCVHNASTRPSKDTGNVWDQLVGMNSSPANTSSTTSLGNGAGTAPGASLMGKSSLDSRHRHHIIVHGDGVVLPAR